MRKSCDQRTRKCVVATLLVFVFMVGLAWPGRAERKASLVILPFFSERPGDPGQRNVCPICQKPIRRGNIPPEALRSLTRLLQQKMESQGQFQILPAEEVEKYPERFRGEDSPIPSAIEWGKALKADYVFVGFLYRFEERVGSSLGVEKPASVGYDLHLLRVKDGKMVWNERFDETQQPLSDDLLKIGAFIRRKGVWLRAEELASVGMDEILRKLPKPEELEKVR